MPKTTVTIEIPVRGFKDLADFLTDHESDIANNINDFGALGELYKSVYEDEPVTNLNR